MAKETDVRIDGRSLMPGGIDANLTPSATSSSESSAEEVVIAPEGDNPSNVPSSLVPSSVVPSVVPTPVVPSAVPTPVVPTRPIPVRPVPRTLTPVSVAMINTMEALGNLTKEFPDMAPTFNEVNYNIAQIIPIIEEFADELDVKPTAPASAIEEEVVPHVYEAAYMTEVAADIIFDSLEEKPAPQPAPEGKIDPEVAAYVAETNAWVEATYEILGE